LAPKRDPSIRRNRSGPTQSITTPGIREYYLYHSDAADLNKAMEALKATHPTYRIEKDTIADPEWNEYRKYASFERS
jgi:hypothetical protein